MWDCIHRDFLTPVSGKVQNPDRYLKTLNILSTYIFEEGSCVFNGVQFIVSVNTEVSVILHCLHADPMDGTKTHCCSCPPHTQYQFISLCYMKLQMVLLSPHDKVFHHSLVLFLIIISDTSHLCTAIGKHL